MTGISASLQLHAPDELRQLPESILLGSDTAVRGLNQRISGHLPSWCTVLSLTVILPRSVLFVFEHQAAIRNGFLETLCAFDSAGTAAEPQDLQCLQPAKHFQTGVRNTMDAVQI